ncbi:hypothetical protein ILUMI_03009, partial [Ignelater luminosus]
RERDDPDSMRGRAETAAGSMEPAMPGPGIIKLIAFKNVSSINGRSSPVLMLIWFQS